VNINQLFKSFGLTQRCWNLSQVYRLEADDLSTTNAIKTVKVHLWKLAYKWKNFKSHRQMTNCC